jgi:ribosome biogenesis GTPase
MTLQDLGFTEVLARYTQEQNLTGFQIGRVVAEHKERYVVLAGEGQLDAEITGNMRFGAQSRKDFPAVGDWVTLQVYEANFAIIHHILPRVSAISRQAVGQEGELQIIATNIDSAFLVQAVDRDFNLNRLERYLTICYGSKVSPVIVLTKIDLIDTDKLSEIISEINSRIHDIPFLAISSESGEGYPELIAHLEKGKTYCVLGSSGVGKSSLINRLSGETTMKTGAISESTQKGRHVTSHRQLVVLEHGALLIDTPGMREVGLAMPVPVWRKPLMKFRDWVPGVNMPTAPTPGSRVALCGMLWRKGSWIPRPIITI